MNSFFNSKTCCLKTLCLRLMDTILDEDTILDKTAHPLLVVFINEDESEGRRGFSLGDPPSDSEILDRMVKWWQLGSRVQKWEKNPELQPKVLVGVALDPAHRIIIGAVKIDKILKSKEPDFYEMRTPEKPSLDAHQLRGRRLCADIKFGRPKTLNFRILPARSDLG